MHIIVCIKQVPDTTEVRLDSTTNTLIRDGVPSIINPFDMYAIEEALRLKEAHGGTVTVLSMGPPQVESALREALALGADKAALLSDRAFAGADTWATSTTLAAGIRALGAFDLVICGKQAIDGDTAQVGPGVAELLGIPQVTFVKKIAAVEAGSMTVHRMVEEGYEVIRTPLPAVLTVVKEINEPRLPSIKGKMRAKKEIITVLNLAAVKEHLGEAKVGLDGSPTRVVKVFTPPRKTGGELWQGEPDELATRLAEFLKKRRMG
ncbi:MAG TPA: electron transfer flavoprotein subunit beta/FixA family protein [bacterium]|nr:electron transfer flavoprotein subunit beta/FixA family protein [bacterium]